MNRQFNKSKNAGGGSKQWVHPPEALLRGHIVYNCKFYGHTEVDEPKGSQVVKDAITKLKFNKQIKRAEGQKPPKVELTVSVDGVTVQEPKYKVMQHRFPLHRISYCADDKSDKRIFTFIAKEADSNKHHCFVFDSEKCAEEITLTIGQAFDLAYKKFLESSRGDMNQRKQDLLLQKKALTKTEQMFGAGYDQPGDRKRQSSSRLMESYGYDQTSSSRSRSIHRPADGSLVFVEVQTLTQENLQLKARVADLERLIDPKVLEELDRNRTNIFHWKIKKGITTKPDEVPVVGRRLENLIFEDQNQSDNKPQTNGTAGVPVLAPPPPIPARSFQGQNAGTPPSGQQRGQVDLFGATPFNPSVAASPTGAPASIQSPTQAQKPVTSPSNPFAATNASDPFGMPAFNPSTATPAELDQQIQKVDKELLDLQTGFSQGLSFADDFNLDDLDPLKQ